MKTPQNFSNHTKRPLLLFRSSIVLAVAAFAHFFLRTVGEFTLDRLALTLLALSLVMATFYVRLYPLRLQDRVIRNEERLRLLEILPDDLRSHVGELTTRQLIGIRFAPDDEVTDIVRRIVDGELTEMKEIKRAVRNWRADHQRI